MQVALGIGSMAETGFLFVNENGLIERCQSDSAAVQAITGYKKRFHRSATEFEYENLDDLRNLDDSETESLGNSESDIPDEPIDLGGFGRVACLIDKLLRQDAVESDEGLQRLSAEVILKNPSVYPSEVLSDRECVPPILKGIIDRTAKGLKKGGVIL